MICGLRNKKIVEVMTFTMRSAPGFVAVLIISLARTLYSSTYFIAPAVTAQTTSVLYF